MYQFEINCCCSSSFICRDTNYEDMLGLCKEEVIRTAKEYITCRSHNGNLRSLRSLRSHGIHHGSLHSHSRAQPQPHAFRRLPCIQDRIHHILRIHHGTLRILRIRSKAQQQPWAQRSLTFAVHSPVSKPVSTISSVSTTVPSVSSVSVVRLSGGLGLSGSLTLSVDSPVSKTVSTISSVSPMAIVRLSGSLCFPM